MNGIKCDGDCFSHFFHIFVFPTLLLLLLFVILLFQECYLFAQFSTDVPMDFSTFVSYIFFQTKRSKTL